MKKNKIKYSLIMMLFISTFVLTIIGCSYNDKVEETITGNSTEDEMKLSLEGYGAKGVLIDKELSLADMLMYAAQDEYIARAEYEAIIKEFDVIRPYSNIMRSEETHLDSLRDIYKTYNIEFPPDISKEQMIIPTTLLEAAKIGVQAEIDNIAMYEEFLKHDLPEDIKDVFNTLMKGSINHLKAFQIQVDKLS